MKRKDWRFQQQTEITLSSHWFNKMRTQQRKSQSERPGITALSLSFWTWGDRRGSECGAASLQGGPTVPCLANQSCQSDQQSTTWYNSDGITSRRLEVASILITHFPSRITHFGGNQVPYQAPLWRRPCGEEQRSAKTHSTSALVASCSSS